MKKYTPLPSSLYEHAHDLMDVQIGVISTAVWDFCESPIEAAFATAFVVLGEHHFGRVAIVERGHERDYPKSVGWQLRFQHDIGRYRADFIASPNPFDKNRSVVVECDGHDFHERTKEQAQRDRSRDREMQMEGWKVFRFTGAEIYRNAFSCATEVFETLLAMQRSEGGQQ